VSIRSILKFPDPRLRQAAAPVSAFDDALRVLADDLLETMRAAPGIGITAPHVGVMLRMVVIELSEAEGPRHYVNPRIVEASAETVRHAEGSVSMPGVSDEVERPARVRVDYQDLDGAVCAEEAQGLLAVCLQHEIDQLDGVFWIQKLSRLKRDRLVKRYEKLGRA
jgi:peptide deformylase